MRSRIIYILTVFAFLFIVSIPTAAQIIDEEGISHEYMFGQQLTISASFPPPSKITKVEFYLLPEGEQITRVYPGNEVKQNLFTTEIDLKQDMLRAFSMVDYWYQAEFDMGEVLTSTIHTLYYEDNRFNWVQYSSTPFTIHRYSGDEVFAQEMQKVALQGLQNIQRYLPLITPDDVNIYAYANNADMRDSLPAAGLAHMLTQISV
jgi:hypothetical protein